MALPSFIGIGAQRAATTWAYNCLREHPEVFVAPGKELHFFDEHFEKGLDWYQSQFSGSEGRRAVGEVTPNYLDAENAMQRMAQIVPRAQLFAILRDPVARAFSAYKLNQAHQGSFRDAYTKYRVFVKLGMYAQHLERVFQHYPREQVKIFLYEDVQRMPQAVLRELFDFIGVDRSFQPPSSTEAFNSILLPNAQKTLERLQLGWTISVAKATLPGKWLRRRLSSRQRSSSDKIPKRDIHELRKLFREDTLRLQEMIGRDLTAWLEVP